MDSYSYIQEQSEDGIEYQFVSEVTNRIYYVGFDPGFYTEFSDQFPNLLSKGVAFSIFSISFDGRTEIEDRTGKDARVQSTIIEISRTYLVAQPSDTVLVYQCDTHDGKQSSRNYLFEKWFTESGGNEGLIKADIEFELTAVDGQTVTHYLGYVISKENSNAVTIANEFQGFCYSMLLM